jgi:hypothetical protein
MSGEGRPGEIDRLVIQQFDPARAAIGGIDTCIGACSSTPHRCPAGRGRGRQSDPNTPLGRWKTVRRGDREIWFLPVARITYPTQRSRSHSARLIAGLLPTGPGFPPPRSGAPRRRRPLHLSAVPPTARVLHSHPGEGCSARRQTRSGGSPGPSRAGRPGRRAAAARVIVFNPAFAEKVRRWNPAPSRAHLVRSCRHGRPARSGESYGVIWVGRLEIPKDPGWPSAASPPGRR